VAVMMQASEIQWSAAERTVALSAFETAYSREVGSLMDEVRSRSSGLAAVEDLWKLHDFLSARRHDLDGKYDNRDSALLFVFAQLVKEGWLSISELDGLDPQKLTKVAALTRL
jgi:Photoprotection regulator fluorescence recovery protein